jgi:transposase
VKAARARFAVAHGKSDRFDAYVLAELARTDAHRFRALVPDGDETKALKALTRAREDLVGVRVELANQLRAQLEAFWPGALIFAEVDSPISLAFLERYPGPADVKGLGAGRMAAFLARNSYSGRTDPAELVARIKAAPEGTAGKVECEARRAVVLGLVAALGSIVSEIAALTARIRRRLEAHPDAGPPRPRRRGGESEEGAWMVARRRTRTAAPGLLEMRHGCDTDLPERPGTER